MKKYLLLMLVVCGIFFYGCSSKQNVASLSLAVNDGVVANQVEQSGVELKIIPNYEKRELNVSYRKSGQADPGPATSNGVVGGDYFDRFLVIADYVSSGELDAYVDKNFTGEGKGALSIVSVAENGVIVRFKVSPNQEGAVLENFRSLYLDLVNLLTESVQV